MNGKNGKYHRLYSDLAWLWPLWGSVEEYREESEEAVELIQKHAKIEVKTLLDITCGGGKNLFHFKKHFDAYGLDISNAMLDNARKLNPECNFYLEDMRYYDLKRQFDSIYLNDGIAYITSADDLLRTFQCAFNHLRAGGVMICYAEFCKEDLIQNKTDNTVSKTDGIEITFIENIYDPDPEDDTFESVMIYLIREKGKLRIEHDFHLCGTFKVDVWRDLLCKAGFEVTEYPKGANTFNAPSFVCVKSKY
ncbi:MAG: class I SAM-dependent methyltransferase [candidate division WOR-3 bacterium]|nr:MAG: class I SAM-dependent methyltransferase [candidate division WOR-3 bacterium]